MPCLTHEGASYQESPFRTSSLPSLLTSAIATPSDRNLPSITVFFHETGEGLSSPWAEVIVSRTADNPRAAVVPIRTFMDRDYLSRSFVEGSGRPPGRLFPQKLLSCRPQDHGVTPGLTGARGRSGRPRGDSGRARSAARLRVVDAWCGSGQDGCL